MTTRILEAQAIISAIDRTGGTLQRVAGNWNSLGKKMMFAGGALSAAVTAPIVAFGVESVRAAVEFEKNFAGVRKVLGDLPAERLKEIKGEIVDLSTKIPLSAEEFASLYEGAAQSGIAQQELREFGRLAAEAAVAFGGSAEQIGTDLAKLKTAGGLTIEQVGNLTDVINELSNTSASAAPDLVAIVQQVGGIARVAGLSYEQTAALGSAMTSAGAGTEVAATAIKNLSLQMTRGAASTKANRTAWKQLGLDAVAVAKSMQTDAAGTIRSVFDRLGKLPEYKRAAVAMQLFGKESLGAIGPLIANLDLLEDALELVGDRSRWTGSRAREFESQMDTADNQIQLLRNNVEALKITLGDEMLPVFKQGLTEALGALRWLNETVGPENTGKIIAYGGALAAIGPALLAIGAGVSGIAKLARVLGGLGALFIRYPALARLLGLGGGAAATAVGIGAAAVGAGYLAYDWHRKYVETQKIVDRNRRESMGEPGFFMPFPDAGKMPGPDGRPRGIGRFEGVIHAEDLASIYLPRDLTGRPLPGGPTTADYVTAGKALNAYSRRLKEITSAHLWLDQAPGAGALLGPLSPFDEPQLKAIGMLQPSTPSERPPMIPVPRSRPVIDIPMPRSRPTFDDVFRGGRIEAEVTGPVTAKLEGKADVNVQIRVDGPGRVIGMSARDAGDIRADVGIGMADAIPGDGQL